jgi:ABC transporter substrate binding protein
MPWAGFSLDRMFDMKRRAFITLLMFDVGFPQAELEMGEVQATARTLGIEVAPLEIRRAEDIAPVFEAQARADALYVVVNALVVVNRTRIITLALGARLPTIFNTREFVQVGGLMSYGPNYPPVSAHRRVGRQDSARDEARRHPCRAADQVRFRHQSHHRSFGDDIATLTNRAVIAILVVSANQNIRSGDIVSNSARSNQEMMSSEMGSTTILRSSNFAVRMSHLGQERHAPLHSITSSASANPMPTQRLGTTSLAAWLNRRGAWDV